MTYQQRRDDYICGIDRIRGIHYRIATERETNLLFAGTTRRFRKEKEKKGARRQIGARRADIFLSRRRPKKPVDP